MPLVGRLGRIIADSHRKPQTRIVRTRKPPDTLYSVWGRLGNCTINISTPPPTESKPTYYIYVFSQYSKSGTRGGISSSSTSLTMDTAAAPVVLVALFHAV